MSLKILRAEEPITVEHLVIVIYSAPGLGKSTLAFTAEKPILLDFDKGCYRAANRKDSVTVDSWADVSGITSEDLAPFSTVVVDTAGRALDFLAADIISKDAKKGNGGALTLQGFGVLKGRFTSWLNALKILGKDVVLIAHASEEKKGDDILERLDIQGGSKGEIYKSADAMGRLYLVNGKRTISFSPTDTAFGKNPGNLPPVLIGDVDTHPDTLAGIISSIKTTLNKLTEVQRKRQNEISDWLAKFQTATTATDFTKLVGEIKKADVSILPILREISTRGPLLRGLPSTRRPGSTPVERKHETHSLPCDYPR